MDQSYAPESEPLRRTTGNPAAASTPPWVKHEKYYFDMVIFQVEDTLFRVPKNSFMNADPESIFPAMFSLPVADETMSEGTDDSRPIVLEGVSKQYFEGFLLVMYPFERTATTFEEWVGALALSTMWLFSEIRERAISALSTMLDEVDPLRILFMARKYGVRDWLKRSLLRLIGDKSLKLESLRFPVPLDWETISRIFALQAYFMRDESAHDKGLELEKMFAEELQDTKDGWSGTVSYPSTSSNAGTTANLEASHNFMTNTCRHSMYYLEDITILVGSSLVRVPKHRFLEAGTNFGKTYGLSRRTDEDSEPSVNGSSEKFPVALESSVSEENFEGFLNVLYPLRGIPTSFSDWIGALDLATRWQFDTMREKSIAFLTPGIFKSNAAESVALGKKYRVKNWILSGYLRLVEQPSLTYTDLRHPFELEWQSITKVLHIRSILLQSQLKAPSNAFANTNFADRPRARCANCRLVTSRQGKNLCVYRCTNLKVRSESFDERPPDAAVKTEVIADNKSSLIEVEFADGLVGLT